MAFVSLIFAAQKLKKLQKALEEEKLDAIKTNDDKTYRKKFKFRHIGVDIREALKQCFRKAFRCSEGSRGYETCYKLGREGSCENYVLKSALGFVGGVFLTYFLYIVFIFQLNVKLTSATIICSVLGCMLTVGLAFSSKVRCIVLLTLPQFFSKRGRQALLAYAFVLALTGPAQNTLNNLGILSESLACGQEQLKQAVKQIIDVIKKPFMTIKEAIKKVIKTVKEVVKKIKEILMKIKRVVMAIVRVIKSVFEFLGKIINICNKELGTPFERCSRVFENAIADCNAKLGPLFNWLCSLAYIVKAVCYIVKVFDYVCMIVDFISNSVVGVIIRKIKIFVRHIKTMFYVRIKFSHSFEYKTISSKSIKDIAKEIVAEIKGRSRGIVAFFNFMTSASMLFLMYLIFQVAYYRFKYLTSERYDNIYINQYFREIDQRRAKAGKETVLPLTKKEKQTYVPINSGELAKTEKRSLTKNATKLATASVKLGTHMAADYILYWVLTLISHHARYQSKVQAPNLPVAHITGEGFIAKLLRSIVNAFQPVGIKLEIDTVPCLPIPIPPDFDRYVQIGITIVICWILTILEPYGLRFRNYIMGYYHPLRAKQRTIWLYNHLLRSRTSFLLLARRKLRRKFGTKGSSGEMSCKDLLRSKLKCGIFKICLGSDLQLTCLLCGDVFQESDQTKFIKCSTPQCPGLFCIECFADLNNICPVCLSPLEYGDIVDIDEEKDSSGDEPPSDKPKKNVRCPWLPCGAKAESDDEKPLITKDDELNEIVEKPQDSEKAAEESDSSTDYSYSYQYDSDLESKEPLPEPTVWKDVEMQAGVDEASMQTFMEEEEEEEYLCIDLDNRIRVPKKHAALVRMDVKAAPADPEPAESVQADTQTIYLDFDNRLRVKKGYNALVQLDVAADLEEVNLEKDKQSFPSPCTCSAASGTRRVEFIGLPQRVHEFHKTVRRLRDLPSDFPCICSDLENMEEIPKSTMSTSTRSDCKFCRCPNVEIRSTLTAGSETEEDLKNIVPKLDLSFLKERDNVCSCDENTVLSNRFSYVAYQEVCETPPTSPSNRSLESSTILSSLQNSPVIEDGPLLRNRKKQKKQAENLQEKNIKKQWIDPIVDSSSSIDSFEFSQAQNRKVRQYYEATRQICPEQRPQQNRKKAFISDMFRRLLPKRKKAHNYLPLHRQEVDDEVQVQSYNYNRENWDTITLDTNSPTYPFGSQTSSDTSDEEKKLLGGNRIRGGECTQLVNCRPIGKKRREKRVGSFDAKSELIRGRTKLKDFSTLSLPPKPKPANAKELISRYFHNNTGLLQIAEERESSMKSVRPPKSKQSASATNLADREDSSDYILPTGEVSTLRLAEDATPPSSDSGLSESTCLELFGASCPQGIGKTASNFIKNSGQPEEEKEDKKEQPVIEGKISEGKDSNLSGKTIRSTSLSSGGSQISQQRLETASNQSEIRLPVETKPVISELPTNPNLEYQLESKNEKSSASLEVQKKADIAKLSFTESGSAQLHPKLSEFQQEAHTSKESIDIAEPTSTSNTSKLLAKRQSAQLNQLLYKDDRTEISLVQRLSPNKGSVKTHTISGRIPALSPRPAPSVKLQISLHNSIIPEEEPEQPIEAGKIIAEAYVVEMTSPKSQDKIVTTRDSFPLHNDWLSNETSRSGKLILSSDKTQQTSDNDIYQSSNIKDAPSRDLKSSSSVPINQRSGSSPYYSSELPERDATCKTNCKCSICKIAQSHRERSTNQTINLANVRQEDTHLGYSSRQEETVCGCCKCINQRERFLQQTLPPVRRKVPTRNLPNYKVTGFPPTSTDSELPQFLPPPPPRPTRRSTSRPTPPNRNLPDYRRGCGEQCDCYFKQQFAGFSGDYSQVPASYQFRPLPDTYGFQTPYQAGYNDFDDDQFDYSNPDPNLSDLPYQNNEEYLELVQELQDTLHTRNRNRVKRAMQEFEDRSKHNKPLEKPIINYDETSESEEPIIRKIDQMRTDRKMSGAEEKYTYAKPKSCPKPPPHPRRESQRNDQFAAEERPSHWTMDPSSGEWQKGNKNARPKGRRMPQGEFDCTCSCNCEHKYQ